MKYYLGVFATLVAWLAFIVYAHHLMHVYVDEIKEILGTTPYQLLAQIVIVSAVFYLIILSFPFLPNVGIRGLSVIVIWVTLIVFGHYLSHEGVEGTTHILESARCTVGREGLIFGAMAYLVLLSLPFVPGVELGLLLMSLFGREGIIVVYLATVGGLSLAYAVGRWLPTHVVSVWSQKLGGVEGDRDSPDSVTVLMDRSKLGRKFQHRLGSFFLRFRYIALALLFNLPGNAALGGGGGIALVCGTSRQFAWKWFFLTTILATAPIPILAFSGVLPIDFFLERQIRLHDIFIMLEFF
ncbi:MAG: hypothetical protein ACE5K9_01470 [Candidatus Methylomirabilales bacterium]